jgi:hypothetical protein
MAVPYYERRGVDQDSWNLLTVVGTGCAGRFGVAFDDQSGRECSELLGTCRDAEFMHVRRATACRHHRMPARAGRQPRHQNPNQAPVLSEVGQIGYWLAVEIMHAWSEWTAFPHNLTGYCTFQHRRWVVISPRRLAALR